MTQSGGKKSNLSNYSAERLTSVKDFRKVLQDGQVYCLENGSKTLQHNPGELVSNTNIIIHIP